jgi:rhodanese-related sulfurtransferase
MKLFARAPAVDPLAASDRIAAGTVLVVDVRQPAEWNGGHIRGAVHIPLTQLATRIDRIPAGKTILTVCRSGHRSSAAAATLRRAGHDVLNLRGGLTAWTRAGLPLERDPRRRR